MPMFRGLLTILVAAGLAAWTAAPALAVTTATNTFTNLNPNCHTAPNPCVNYYGLHVEYNTKVSYPPSYQISNPCGDGHGPGVGLFLSSGQGTKTLVWTADTANGGTPVDNTCSEQINVTGHPKSVVVTRWWWLDANGQQVGAVHTGCVAADGCTRP